MNSHEFFYAIKNRFEKNSKKKINAFSLVFIFHLAKFFSCKFISFHVISYEFLRIDMKWFPWIHLNSPKFNWIHMKTRDLSGTVWWLWKLNQIRADLKSSKSAENRSENSLRIIVFFIQWSNIFLLNFTILISGIGLKNCKFISDSKTTPKQGLNSY